MQFFDSGELFLRGTPPSAWEDGELQSGAFRTSKGCSVVRVGNRSLKESVVKLTKKRGQPVVAVSKEECDEAGVKILENPSRRDPNHCLLMQSNGVMRLTVGQARHLAAAATKRKILTTPDLGVSIEGAPYVILGENDEQ